MNIEKHDIRGDQDNIRLGSVRLGGMVEGSGHGDGDIITIRIWS
jgi:hypothetical protein